MNTHIENGPLATLITTVPAHTAVVIDASILAQLQAAAEVAQNIADEETYEASLDQHDHAFIAYVDTFLRRQQRRNAKRQWGR